MASTIGIKIANGEFYSIIEENSTVKKRLVLTTVHDKQRSVQIDLYRSFAKTMADALYIGSLVVENIKPKPRGEPSIEMVISSKRNGDITAEAIDMDTSAKGEHHILTVSLKSLDEDNRDMDIPDFALEQHEGPPTGLYERARKVKKSKESKGAPGLIFVLAGLVLIVLILGLWFFFLRQRGILPYEFPFEKDRPPAESFVPANPPPAQTPPAVQPPVSPPPARTPPAVQPPASPPPVIQAPIQQPAPRQTANRVRPPAPVSSYNVPAVIPSEGAPYRIRWGDTLWDISEAFYRNPWLYPRIARFNQIRNPNLIISGTTIRIPPKN